SDSAANAGIVTRRSSEASSRQVVATFTGNLLLSMIDGLRDDRSGIAVEMEQLRRRVDEDDAPRVLVGDPVPQPAHTLRVADLVLVRDERPVARPDELPAGTRLEQRVDIALRICAAEAIRRRQLDPGIAFAHAAQHFPEARAF